MTTPVPPARSARRARVVIKPSAATASLGPQQPAAVASGRVFGASVLLGLLGLASAVFVVTRLFESWRVTSEPASHVVSIFGARLTYPAANTGAIIVTALAGLGLLMAGAAAWRLARELLADRSFRRALAASPPAPLDRAWVITDDRPQAFCAGLLRPRVYFSTGALELLDAPALAAVLAHEHHHAIRHDPLRLACARVLAAGLFFIPAMRRLVQRQDALAEISADEAAVLTAGVERSGLASAMLSFSQASGADALGIDPERVDYLIGERPQWRFPVALCLGIAAALSLLIAVAVLAAHAAAGSATLAPPFLSSQPCVAVLAMIPAAAGLAGLVYVRTRQTPQTVEPAQQ
ncbi:MAG TPA: M56 family metallopeptidase [Solirubrobacteraceae bacterium]|nr:M56 family metallopeptidase [Solirubrobacteraceae bacterium]